MHVKPPPQSRTQTHTLRTYVLWGLGMRLPSFRGNAVVALDFRRTSWVSTVVKCGLRATHLG